MRNNWLFTRNFNEYKEKYSPFVGQVFDVYDIPTKSLYKAKIVDFVKRDKWNSIVCADIETGELLEINENYVNFNNELWWMYNKAHKDGVAEFEEYYKDYYGIETDCFYNNNLYICEVLSIDKNNHYTPKLKCKIQELNKEVNMSINDVNLSGNKEEWLDNQIKTKPDYQRRLNFYNMYSHQIGKTYEVYNKNTGLVEKRVVSDVSMFETIIMKSLINDSLIEVPIDYINFTDDYLNLYRVHKLDPHPALTDKYQKLIGNGIDYFINYEIKKVKFIGFKTTEEKTNKSGIDGLSYKIEVIYVDETNVETTTTLENVNIDNSKRWLKDKEQKIVKYHQKLKEDELKKQLIEEQKKKNKEAEEKRIALERTKIEKIKSCEDELIGQTFECVHGNTFKQCKIIDITQNHKKKKITIKSEVNGSILMLNYKNVNILDDPDWHIYKENEIKKKEQQKQVENSYESAWMKNHDLVEDLSIMRMAMCGIGTKKVKLFLNKKIKEGDDIAELYRLALEIEDCNVSAKRYYGSYKTNYYATKHKLIQDLSYKCLLYNKTHSDTIKYGKQSEDGYSTTHIVYYELPNCKQISFHCSLSKNEANSMPNYDDIWDGLVNSTLFKLEDAINKRYFKENQ